MIYFLFSISEDFCSVDVCLVFYCGNVYCFFGGGGGGSLRNVASILIDCQLSYHSYNFEW